MAWLNPNVMVLPVSVIIPTRNCRSDLERHLNVMEACFERVAQVIAIDSESTDGTRELLDQRLPRFGALVVTHPPGLYQSWNTACSLATAPWIYVSTVGDTIEFAGLEDLLTVAEHLDADVVISPPRMMQSDGRTPADTRWPIHYLAEALGDDAAPRMLSKSETVMTLCSFGSASLLGSSAANIYRTTVLQQHPFPLQFGHAGDTAWALQNCALLRLAILPRAVSIFCLGWQFRDSDPRLQRELFLALMREAETALAGSGDPEHRLALGWLRALVAHQTTLWDWVANQADLVQDHADLRDYLEQVEAEKARSLRSRVKRLLGR